MLVEDISEVPVSIAERKRKQDPDAESPASKKLRSVGVIDSDIIVL